jgi:hypothetical protein
MLFTYVINQKAHIYKYVQSHFIIVHSYVLATSVTTLSVSYIKNTIDI